MTAFKKVLKNSSYLLGSRLLSRLIFIVFVIYAASRLGPELFGILAFALATVELLSSIGDLGLTRYGARELVRHWDDRPVLAGEILVLQILTSLFFSLGGLLLVIAWRPDDPKFQLLLLGLVAIFLSGLVNTTETIFIAGQRFFYSALLTFIGRLIYVGIGFAALAAGASVIMVMWGFVAAVVVESLFRMLVVIRTVTRFSFSFSAGRLWKMFVATLPFAIAAAANVAFLRVNVMVLELLDGDVAVGVFSVAFTLFTPFIWIPMIINRTLFSGLTEDFANNPDRARHSTWQWYRLMAMAGIPAALAITLLAGPVFSHFPAGYEGSAGVLQILIWALPLLLVISIGFNTMQIINRERASARVQMSGALANAAACFALIPPFGIKGAAAATVVGAAVMEAQIYLDLHKHFLQRKHTIVLFLRPVVGGLVMTAVALPLYGFNPWLATGAGLVAYAAAILVTGGVRISELKSLLGS